MIVKSVLKEEPLTLSEVRALLDEVRQKRAGETEELGYELRRAIKHAELFAEVTPERSRKMVEELLKFEKVSPEVALKIADIMPQNRDEIRAIYAKERFTLTEDELDKILDVVLMG